MNSDNEHLDLYLFWWTRDYYQSELLEWLVPRTDPIDLALV